MNATDWIVKAERAATSAKLLLEAGDLEGACNRAYYAMFDGARAALISTEAEIWRYFPLTPNPSPRGRGAKENRRKFLLQYLATGAPAEAQTAKTHNGLIAAFSRCLVKTGRVSVESKTCLGLQVGTRSVHSAFPRGVWERGKKYGKY